MSSSSHPIVCQGCQVIDFYAKPLVVSNDSRNNKRFSTFYLITPSRDHLHHVVHASGNWVPYNFTTFPPYIWRARRVLMSLNWWHECIKHSPVALFWQISRNSTLLINAPWEWLQVYRHCSNKRSWLAQHRVPRDPFFRLGVILYDAGEVSAV